MAIERTLCIMKPDALEKGAQGAIVQRILDEGFRILGMRQTLLSRAVAEGFYAVHRERPFFDELCTFMTRGAVIVAAVEHWRTVIGATDPAKAADGTIRKRYGSNVGENVVHGSDSRENGVIECSYFFAGYELLEPRNGFVAKNAAI
jgi:nucleoside-diphosphate kinase